MFNHHTADFHRPGWVGHRTQDTGHSQFQQRKVGVAVVRSVLALLRDIVLEDGGSLGVVSVQAIQDSIDMLWPVRRIIESDAHC